MEPQNSRPTYPLRLIKVGVKGFKQSISVGKDHYLVNINAYVHLPPSQKGIHMSRIIESIFHSINESGDIKEIEMLVTPMARELLKRHEYAEIVGISMKFPFFYETTHGSQLMKEMALGYTNVVYTRMQKNYQRVGVKLEGMTVCPCGIETFKEFEKAEGLVPSHTQRCVLNLSVKSSSRVFPLKEQVAIGKKAFSAETFNLLKREDEYRLIKRGFENPMFIEDVVRAVLYDLAVACKLHGFPLEDTEITVEAESLESIHKFNAYAGKRIILKELLDEVSRWSLY